MKITGIIAEYNPFHNGHLYQLEKAKKLTGANFIIIVMSGDFVQRGIPACLSKIQRTKMALACGADLVLELPVRYATSSAEYFARGAIGILEHLNTDYICFGSESGDLKLLSHIAHFIQKDCDDFNKQLSYYVSCGDSYPKARKKAISLCLNNNITKNNLSLLDTPNNILAIEYLKALFYYRSNISPITIKRIHSNYHEPALHTSKQNIFSINSATAIRNTILKTGNI